MTVKNSFDFNVSFNFFVLKWKLGRYFRFLGD